MNSIRLTASILTVIAIGLTIVNLLTPGEELGFLALPFIAAAGVAWWRHLRQMDCRERTAYEVGRASVPPAR